MRPPPRLVARARSAGAARSEYNAAFAPRQATQVFQRGPAVQLTRTSSLHTVLLFISSVVTAHVDDWVIPPWNRHIGPQQPSILSMFSHAACFRGCASLTAFRPSRFVVRVRFAPFCPRAVASGVQRAATTAAPSAASMPLRLSTKAESSRFDEVPDTVDGETPLRRPIPWLSALVLTAACFDCSGNRRHQPAIGHISGSTTPVRILRTRPYPYQGLWIVPDFFFLAPGTG